MDIKIADSVVNSSHESHFYVKRSGGQDRFKVYLFLEGNDLPYVDSVTYYLHPTFKNPVKTIMRTAGNPNCSLVIWTWGLFTVRARVATKSGKVLELQHHLGYDREIKSKSLKPQFT